MRLSQASDVCIKQCIRDQSKSAEQFHLHELIWREFPKLSRHGKPRRDYVVLWRGQYLLAGFVHGSIKRQPRFVTPMNDSHGIFKSVHRHWKLHPRLVVKIHFHSCIKKKTAKCTPLDAHSLVEIVKLLTATEYICYCWCERKCLFS